MQILSLSSVMQSNITRTYLLSHAKEISQNYAVGALSVVCIFFFSPHFLWKWILLLCGGLLLSSVFADLIHRWRPRRRLPLSEKAVFITGCDSGFGKLAAQRFDELGFRVFAGCLFPEGEGALNLKASGSSRLHIVPLDVTKDESVNDAAAYVKGHLEGNELWAVVNNAGINDIGEIHWTETKVFQRIWEVNTMGVVRVTKAFLSSLQKSKGRIVTMASMAGRIGLYGSIPYSMSKSAAISFSDGLGMEMYKWGVQVITIEPFAFRTPILNKDFVVKNITNSWNRAPEEVTQSYGPDYIEKYIKLFHVYLNLAVSDNLMEVAECIVEAVTAIQPRYYYQPGTIPCKFLCCIFPFIPRPLFDFIFIGVANSL